MLTALVAMAATVSAPQAEPVDLYRQFTKGETLKYSVKAHMLTETSDINTSAIPQEVDILYDFSLLFKGVDEGGFAKVDYKRPTVTQIDGETADRPPISTKVKVDMHYEMDLSPINELTNIKDLGKINDKASGGGGYSLKQQRMIRTLKENGVAPAVAVQLGGFEQDLYRMALFVGSFDNALDLNPKLPLDEVVPGDTWSKTVSYQPQAVKGTDGKQQEVQRLDMQYKYDGVVDAGGKKVHQITATVNLDTDAAKYYNQGSSAARTGLQALPLRFNTEIIFTLDLATKRTLSANAKTTGGYEVVLTQISQALIKEKITGTASMKLLP